MAIQWDNIQHPNIFASFQQGVDSGRKVRAEKDARNAFNLFAQDPDAGAAEMVRLGRPDLAASAMTARAGMDRSRARRTAAPLLEKGDYKGASRAVAGLDPELSKQIEGWDRDQLDHAYKVGERSARVLMAASNIPDPQSRRQFIDEHTEELTGLGYTPEQIAGYDVNNVPKMRADATRFMEISSQAGKTSVEKFGDYAVRYDTDPVNGTRVVSKTEIPPTRAERRQERAEERQQKEFEYRQDHDGKELSLRERELQLRQFMADNPDSSPAKVMGPIFRKLAEGKQLSAGEHQALKYYKLDPLTAEAVSGAGDAEEYGAGGAQPPPAAGGGRRAPAGRGAPGSQGNPARPKSRAEAEALPRGAWFTDPAGNLIQKK